MTSVEPIIQRLARPECEIRTRDRSVVDRLMNSRRYTEIRIHSAIGM